MVCRCVASRLQVFQVSRFKTRVYQQCVGTPGLSCDFLKHRWGNPVNGICLPDKLKNGVAKTPRSRGAQSFYSCRCVGKIPERNVEPCVIFQARALRRQKRPAGQQEQQTEDDGKACSPGILTQPDDYRAADFPRASRPAILVRTVSLRSFMVTSGGICLSRHDASAQFPARRGAFPITPGKSRQPSRSACLS